MVYIHKIEYYPAIEGMKYDVSMWVNLKKIMLGERNQKCHVGTSLVAQWLGLHGPNVGGQGSIPGHKSRSKMPQWRLKTQCDATKMQCSQIKKNFLMPCVVWFHLYEISRIGKFIEIESRLAVLRGWRENRMWLPGNDENVLELDRWLYTLWA